MHKSELAIAYLDNMDKSKNKMIMTLVMYFITVMQIAALNDTFISSKQRYAISKSYVYLKSILDLLLVSAI